MQTSMKNIRLVRFMKQLWIGVASVVLGALTVTILLIAGVFLMIYLAKRFLTVIHEEYLEHNTSSFRKE